jgi:hypothetical protein
VKSQYFIELGLDKRALQRNYGMIAVLWYLVRALGPRSKWLQNIADLIDTKPQLACCPYEAMGFPNETGFPREKFGLPLRSTPVEEQC